MKRFGRIALLIASTLASSAHAVGRSPADLNWPCHQNKVSEFPLASVWDGPAIDTNDRAWRDDPVTRALSAQMAQRRVPIEDVSGAVQKVLASSAPSGREKIKQAFGAAFAELVRQRGEIIAGLDRFGGKQREMANNIRAENESAHAETVPGVATQDSALQKLQWDLRVYDERRHTINYVCEAPQAIEARIGALVKIVREAMGGT